VRYFVIEERYNIVCVIVNLQWAVRIGIARTVRLVVITVIEQAGCIGIRGREIWIAS
jgi:hypothetical protein